MKLDEVLGTPKTSCLHRLLIAFAGRSTGDSDGKESSCNAGDPGSIPGSGRYPGEENGYPLQYSCLDNSMERGRLYRP